MVAAVEEAAVEEAAQREAPASQRCRGWVKAPRSAGERPKWRRQQAEGDPWAVVGARLRTPSEVGGGGGWK